MMSLAQCCEIISGATPKTGVASYWDGDIDWVTPADLSDLEGPFIDETPRKITKAGLASCSATVLPVGAVLLSSRAPIGHVAIALRPMATNQGFKSLVPRAEVVDPKYLYHWLRTNKSHLQSLGNGATFKELSKAAVARIEIPVPSLGEQRRISAMLDQADVLRDKRRQALAHLDALTQSIFLDMFDDPNLEVTTLGLVAEVQGGLQVTATRASLPLQVPYLRVANVHRNRLDLTEMKTLQVTARELERIRLQDGDLLLVEGHGNPTEVGRAAVWRGQVPDCVHQNHLIRVRLDQSKVLPGFAAAWLSSAEGRRHLLRSAKTTSGLNTINTSNVKATPIPSPPLEQQGRFVALVESAAKVFARFRQSLTDIDELTDSLRDRAFREPVAFADLGT